MSFCVAGGGSVGWVDACTLLETGFCRLVEGLDGWRRGSGGWVGKATGVKLKRMAGTTAARGAGTDWSHQSSARWPPKTPKTRQTMRHKISFLSP